MPTREFPIEFLDEMIRLHEKADAVLAWLKANPDAPADEAKLHWELDDALDASYNRLAGLEKMYRDRKLRSL